MGRKGKKKSTANGSSRKGHKRAQDEQPPVPAAKGEHITDDDLKGMKCWIESLTFEKLIESLEFSFHRDGNLGNSCRQDQEVVETFASQDFDLLIKMTTIQRRKSKLYGSSSGDGDGHNSNDIYYSCDRRRYRKQLENLCLFRLVDPEMERKSNSTNLTPCKSPPKTKPLHEDNNIPELSQLATDLPAELMDILSKAGVKRSTSDLLETFNEVDEVDKAFESPDEENDSATFVQYQIEIHEGIADDGTMLGQGSTSEQRTADGSLLLWTVLFSDTQSLSNDSNSEISSSSHLPHCKLHAGQLSSNSSNQKMALLDLLLVTSRGNFLSAKGKRSQSYWAPWFEPMQRWFSLPMYLASRYESALWDAYFNRTKLDETNVLKNSLLQSVENLGEESVERVLSYAFGEAVKKEMIQTSLLQESGSFVMTMVLENLLKNLLKYENDCGHGEELSMHKRLEFLSVSPLLQWGTPRVELKSLVTKFISHGLSHEAEKSLMQSLSAEDNETKTQKNRKTIRKKRLNHHQPEILSTLEEEQSEEEQESDEDPFVESILPHTSVGAVTESKTGSESNRGTCEKIIVLQVIDDILTTVFQRLGMEEDTNNDFTDAVLVTSRSDLCQTEGTRNDDDIEAATTAVVSNKASASVDAAMKFLRRKDADSPSHSHSPKRSQHLWASRNRRESLDVHVHQQSGLKRCLSSGAQAVDAEPIPPQYKRQPNRRHNRSSSLGYSTSIDVGLTDILDREKEFAARMENSYVNPVSSTSASIASSRSDLNEPGLDIDDYLIPAQITQRPAGLPPTTPSASTQPSSTALSLSGIGKFRVDANAAMGNTMTTSLSRDDLRSIDETFKLPRRRDDHHTMGHRQVDALLSYRNAVARSSLPRNPASVKSHDGKQKHRDDTVPIKARSVKSTRTGIWVPGDFPSLSSSVPSIHSYREPMINKILHLDLACARSESALDVDGAEDASHCNVIPTQNDDTITKDGATTISSVRSTSDVEPDRLASSLKEERNSYRDMCLTLGAENAKLRNLLASKVCAPLYHPPQFSADAPPHFQQNILYDHHQRPPSYHQYMSVYNGGANFTAQPIVAMSDAGLHRGDYDSSAMSEDGTDFHPSVVGNSISWQPRGDSVHSFSRRTSVGGTYADSDASLEHGPGGPGFHRIHYQDSFFGPIPLHGMQSRLSKDIDRYMQSLKSQLKKNEQRRTFAVNQITKAVNALWPRAQIKMYGSHVTKLCLPSSDMDFVICLPAVHKNAPAATPGDLEGRNAINETNQKILARKLKGENWLDQRSIKVIERTAVPVIKVSTKDSRSRIVQLDLSFDAKEHHGLEALDMIRHLLEEIPMIRPLVLVLKQFLLDRGLLTAYTGGLSSYCLFLMVARYCQEQSPTWNDRGSLLMGLLDFYGNFFDPRTTGISVRTRRYFSRFGENQHQEARRNNAAPKPPRFQPLNRQSSFHTSHQANQLQPGKFDPIWVEDPLNPGNNVGRNAFRIFQVQRAFSDAHRALVAALEWDINSMSEFGEDGEYPLLKCLFQNEDVFFSMDEPAPIRTSLGASPK
eukprot:scaffold28851_cov148-Skeletonema_menzelii.AAC.3